jgi:hypothetical protein
MAEIQKLVSYAVWIITCVNKKSDPTLITTKTIRSLTISVMTEYSNDQVP